LCRSGRGVPLPCLERYARDRAVRPIWLPTGQGFFFGAPRRCDLQHCHGLGALSSSPWAKEGRCAKLPGLPTKEVPQDPAPLLDRPCLLEPAPPGFVFSPLWPVRPISRTPLSRSHSFARHLFLHCASVLVAWPPSAVLCDLPSFFATVSEVGCDEVSRRHKFGLLGHLVHHPTVVPPRARRVAGSAGLPPLLQHPMEAS